MRIVVEQEIPTDFGTLCEFMSATTRLINSDMSAYVTVYDGWLRVCSAAENQ